MNAFALWLTRRAARRRFKASLAEDARRFREALALRQAELEEFRARERACRLYHPIEFQEDFEMEQAS